MLLVLFSLFLIGHASTVVINDRKYAGDPKAARDDSLVTHQQRGGKQDIWKLGHAGHVKVSLDSEEERDNYIYFWFQPCDPNYCEQRGTPPKTILWLQGGPGGTGTFGSVSELGRFWVNQDSKGYYFQKRAFTWCRYYSCLFVDQPVKTGYSYQTLNGVIIKDKNKVQYTKDSKEAMKQIRELLNAFYIVWPDRADDHLYIGSESYGGHYAPNLAEAIFDWNDNVPKEKQILLTGMAVGDPILHPPTQYLTYADTLFGMGVIDRKQQAVIRSTMQAAVGLLDINCSHSFNFWNAVWADDRGGKDGLFDLFTGSTATMELLVGNSPEELSYFSDWIDVDHSLMEAFHVDELGAVSHDEGGLVYSSMVDSGDFCQSEAARYAELFVKRNLEIMIYSSNSDPLLGPPTTEEGVAAIVRAAGLEELWQAENRAVWKANENDDFPAGYYKCISLNGKKLCYVVVRNAGHMTPSFQPRTSYDMFERFITREFFESEGTLTQDLDECGGCRPFTGPKMILACNDYHEFQHDPWDPEEKCE